MLNLCTLVVENILLRLPTIANEYYFQTLEMLLFIILKVVSKR